MGQIAGGGMQRYAIEPCGFCIADGLLEAVQQRLHLSGLQGARRRHLRHPLLAPQDRRVDLHGRGGNQTSTKKSGG
jgi:hypothetical protein